MVYILQYSAYSGILYTAYLALLRNRPGHAWNRLYLLACAILPLALPFIKIPGLATTVPGISYQLPEIVIQSSPAANSISALSAYRLFPVLYIVVCLALLAWSAYQLLSMMTRVGKHNYSMENGARIFTNTGVGPGSLGNYIFFPGNEVDAEILRHEMAHVRLHHTADMLLARVLQCLFWPNIFLHLIIRELRMIHEFQADERSAQDTSSFCTVLLAQTFRVRPGLIEHTFFHHPIKRRIAMLQKRTDRRRPLIPAVIRSGFAALLITTGIIYLQSCSRKAMPEPQVYTFAEVMPHADYDLPTYLGNNIKYPEDAQKRKVEGRVIIKFVVDKDGAITKPQIIRSPDQQLSDEAVRVVSAMPKWQPAMQDNKNVPVYFTLPITFALGNSTAPAAK